MIDLIFSLNLMIYDKLNEPNSNFIKAIQLAFE